MLFGGTYSLTKKKSRTNSDFPLHKLSNSAMKRVERGWECTAFKKGHSAGKLHYTLQATMWIDKKLICFLHNHLVDGDSEENVERWSSRRRRKEKIKSHPVTKDYTLHMKGVDHKDRDTLIGQFR